MDEQRRSGGRTIATFAIAAVAAIGIPVVLARAVDTPAGAVHEVVIPAGTAHRLAAGETLDVVPDSLALRARDRLLVVNEDDVAHQVGPVLVQPGERVEQRVSTAMDRDYTCSLHPGGRIEITVRA